MKKYAIRFIGDTGMKYVTAEHDELKNGALYFWGDIEEDDHGNRIVSRCNVFVNFAQVAWIEITEDADE